MPAASGPAWPSPCPSPPPSRARRCRRRGRRPAPASPGPCRPRPAGRAAAAARRSGAPASTASASIGVGDTTGPDGSSRPGKASGPAASAAAAPSASAHWPSVEMPIGVMRYFGRVRGAQHVGGRRARHVVFGRLPAEQHHEVDPIVAHPVAVPSWSIGRTVPFDLVRILASDAAAAVGGRLVGPDVEFDGASFDSRSTAAGRAVRADRRRARRPRLHRSARARPGRRRYLTSEPARPSDGGTAIEVADTSDGADDARAVGASADRRARVVGVTGSVGKTSTKDFIAAACAATRRTTANERSFNNEQGLPVTILNAPDDTEVLVLEMGMRGFGEIARLCDVARPDIGVVTAVGRCPHRTGRWDRRRGGRQARTRRRRCPRRGPRCSTPTTNGWRRWRRTPAASVRHVRRATATCGSIDLVLDELARARFTIDTPWGRAVVELAMSGAHMAIERRRRDRRRRCRRRPVGRRRRRRLDRHGLGDADAGDRRCRTGRRSSTTPTTPTRPRWLPRSTHSPRCGATRRVAVLGLMAELDDPVAGTPRDRRRWWRRLGIELIAVGTDRYGVEPSTDPIAALGDRVRATSCS